MHRRLFTFFEGVDYGVQMHIEGAMEFPIEIVEISSLPHFGGFVADRLKAKTLHRVINQNTPLGSVNFEEMSVLISVRRIVSAHHASDCPVAETERQSH